MQTAKNPVARAFAQKGLRSDIVDQKIKLYLTEDGEPCADFCAGIGLTLSAMIRAAELDRRVGKDHLLTRIARGGASACEQMVKTDSFDRTNLVSLDKALDAIVDLNLRLSAEAVNQGWKEALTGKL
jgi:hypothetical protein